MQILKYLGSVCPSAHTTNVLNNLHICQWYANFFEEFKTVCTFQEKHIDKHIIQFLNAFL